MGDQPHARAGPADLADALLVARAVEHDDHHVADRRALALGDQLDRLAERPVEVEQVGDLRRAGHLLHVHARPGIEHRAAARQRDHRQRARHPVRGERRALQRIDGDVDLRRRAVADPLAVVEHRRLVLLALADHDDAVHLHRLQHVAHAVDRRLIGGLLVAEPDERRAASAAASVTRTSSSARFLSGRWCVWSGCCELAEASVGAAAYAAAASSPRRIGSREPISTSPRARLRRARP